ncbi:hypothetical protein [Rahnella variigena]|uniref:hypothetical protein n=1 Tax=Rahnella variigena TaxID=574964 RepID=UPI00244C9C83|nr:hypothetical protein [Rahnella variigena]MDH2899062.1 hypothetical protein [Rahnella variigena]
MMGKQLVIATLALLAAFAAGWQVNAWYSDSLELVISNAAHAAGEASRVAGEQAASASGRKLEDKLEALRNAQPVEIRTEVVKPVFTNVCVSADFVSLYNAAAAKAERALSGKSVNQMPGKTPAH